MKAKCVCFVFIFILYSTDTSLMNRDHKPHTTRKSHQSKRGFISVWFCLGPAQRVDTPEHFPILKNTSHRVRERDMLLALDSHTSHTRYAISDIKIALMDVHHHPSDIGVGDAFQSEAFLSKI